MTNPNKTSVSNSSASAERLGFILIIVTTLLAIAAHTYLAKVHYDVKFGASTGPSICSINETFNCETVSASDFSELYKTEIPMAVLGAIGNLVLLALTLIIRLTPDAKVAAAKHNVFIFASFILATSVVMGGISSFLLSKYCLFCMAAYVLSIASWFGALQIYKSAHVPLGGSGTNLGKSLLHVSIAGLLVLGGSYMANDKAQGAYGLEERMAPFVIATVREWQAETVQNFDLVSPLEAGPDAKTAKINMIEFADYRCSHCKHASPTLQAFVSSHPDVHFTFLTWPLDGECNTAIPQANGASCALARAGYCGNRLGKGWVIHDWIFDNQSRFVDHDAVTKSYDDMAKLIGIDPGAFHACVDSDEAKKAIEKTSELGNSLHIQGTPTIYINGKRLPPGGQQLSVLKAIYQSLH